MTDWPISARLREYLEVQYDLRRVLGEGGMGVVLLATERALDRQVAIKVLHKHAAAQPELRERFRREARVAARLTHPNIVPLHTFGDVEGELFFVMGFVEGETLASRLRRDGRIPQVEALRILREVCDALSLAHAQSVVHRDIKPENVLIESRDGRVLFADFGIAREGTDSLALTGTGIAIGTPHYMSPEQAVPSGGVDHRADIYAVGVLAYRMLSGRLPFDGANAREIITQQMVATPRDFSRDHPDVSSHIVAAVLRCLEKDPAGRWQSADALRQALAPVSLVEDELPDELAGVDAMIPKLVAGSLVATWAWTVNQWWWKNELFGDLLPMAIFAPLVAGALVTGAVSWRCGVRRTLGIALRAPRFWTLWWPRSARRPGDVWDRLPVALRVARMMMFIPMFVATPAVLGVLAVMFTLPLERLAAFMSLPLVKYGMPVVAAAQAGGILAAATMVYAWWRRVGGGAQPKRPQPWLALPVASPRWARPEFAQFLEPERAAPKAIPDSAERLGAAIVDALQGLVSAGVIPSSDAAVVARDVVHAIAAIDRELALLARGGDAADLARLNDRIAAAGSDGLADDILGMLMRQRESLDKIIQRQADQRKRRERLVAQLRELFLAIEHVRDRAHATESGGVTDRLEVACSDLRRLAAGYDDLRDGATTPVTSSP